MRRLFVAPPVLASDPVVVEGADHHHLTNVLRVRAGERMHLLDGAGGSWECQIVDVGRTAIGLAKVAPLPVPPEPARRIILAQALGKGDRFEEAIQHATEAGASGFIPLMAERGIRRMEADDVARKAERWRRVLKGAAEQSGRAAVPVLDPGGSVAEVVARFAGDALVFLLHAGGRPLRDAISGSRAATPVVLLVGPEGGFTDVEVTEADAAGAAIVSLGPFALRTETAGVFATAQVLYAAASAAPVLESSHSTR